MKRHLLFWVPVLLIFLSSCSSSGSPTFSEAEDAAAGEPGKRTLAYDDASVADASVANESFTPSLTERLIIRNASLDLVVQDTEASMLQISQLVSELRGIVVSSQMTAFDEGVRASLTVRVPAESLDSALERIRALAKEVRRQITSSEDISEEYTDLQAQLRHLEATEIRLLSFLDEAEDTEATLAVYSELRQVQGDIERLKGRIQYLEQSSALSTINIELTPDALARPISVAGWQPRGTLRGAVEALIRTLQFLVDVLIWVVVYLLPVILLVFGPPVLLLIWLIRRRRQAKSD
jgi:glycine cleavage system regulatory protein